MQDLRFIIGVVCSSLDIKQVPAYLSGLRRKIPRRIFNLTPVKLRPGVEAVQLSEDLGLYTSCSVSVVGCVLYSRHISRSYIWQTRVKYRRKGISSCLLSKCLEPQKFHQCLRARLNRHYQPSSVPRGCVSLICPWNMFLAIQQSDSCLFPWNSQSFVVECDAERATNDDWSLCCRDLNVTEWSTQSTEPSSKVRCTFTHLYFPL